MSRDKIYELIATVLGFIGLGVAWKLLEIHMNLASGQSSMQSNCLIGAASSCEEVALSSYSQIGPVPLAAVAMGFYAALLILLLWKLVIEPNKKELGQIVFNLSTLGLIVAIIMASISTFALSKFCAWCAMLWAVNILLWPLSFKIANYGFGALISGNLNSFAAEKNSMDQKSTYSWMGVAAGVFVLVTLLGTSIESNAIEKANRGGLDRAIRKYNGAQPIFVDPKVMADGPNVKGVSQDKAVLSIVKFSDFQCPACKMAAQAMKPFFLKNKDKVRFVYRNYPLDTKCNPGGGSHAMACDAAYAAVCAGKQDKFYEMHDMLFDGNRELTNAYIKDAAKLIGLDEAKFDACIKDDATKKEVEQDVAWGESIQLRATPTFIVNGRKVEGGFTLMQWEALLQGVEKARAKAGR